MIFSPCLRAFDETSFEDLSSTWHFLLDLSPLDLQSSIFFLFFSRLTSEIFVTWKVTFFRIMYGTKISPTLVLTHLTGYLSPPPPSLMDDSLACPKMSGLSQLQTDRIKDWIQFLIITVHLPTNNEWAITSSGRSLLTSSQGSSKWLKLDRSKFQCLSRT